MNKSIAGLLCGLLLGLALTFSFGQTRLAGVQVLDFTPTIHGGLLTVAAGRVRFLTRVCDNFTSTSLARLLSGSSGPMVGKLYIADSCALVLEYPNAFTLNFDTTNISITAQAVINPSVPDTAFPVADLTIVDGQFTAVADKRSVFSQNAMMAGNGIIVDCTLGPCLISRDSATVPDLGGYNAYTGSEDASNAAKTIPAKFAVGDPPTCAFGEMYETTVGNTIKAVKLCSSPNMWSTIWQAP
jgi:hypothetical protein